MLVDGDGRVKVTDFGIARAGASQMTEAGSIVGTAQYLSPEQARGAPVDQRSDLYSVGIVLYEMLTGTVPFKGDTPVEIAMKHLSQTPEPPSALRPDVPRDLDCVVLRALAKDPAERYQRAEEMDADLDRVAPRPRRLARDRGGGDDRPRRRRRDRGLDARATMVAPPPSRRVPAGRYYEYDEGRAPPLGLAVAARPGSLLAAVVGGIFVYDQIQDQLNATKPVAVPDVRGHAPETHAVQQISRRAWSPTSSERRTRRRPLGHRRRAGPAAGPKRRQGQHRHDQGLDGAAARRGSRTWSGSARSTQSLQS